MIPTFLGDFETQQDVESQFDYTLVGEEIILFAEYDHGGYDGSAYVLIDEGGELKEVYGAHCSCYGLEGQWEPEVVTPKALRDRLKEGHGFDFSDEGKVALFTILDKWERDNDRIVH